MLAQCFFSWNRDRIVSSQLGFAWWPRSYWAFRRQLYAMLCGALPRKRPVKVNKANVSQSGKLTVKSLLLVFGKDWSCFVSSARTKCFPTEFSLPETPEPSAWSSLLGLVQEPREGETEGTWELSEKYRRLALCWCSQLPDLFRGCSCCFIKGALILGD